MNKHRLHRLEFRLAIARLAADDPAPAWATGRFVSVTRTADELSVVCAESQVPAGVQAARGWIAIAVEGPLDFTETGIIAGLSAPLAHAGISTFVISTFDTDYLLVPEDDMDDAADALRNAGYRID